MRSRNYQIWLLLPVMVALAAGCVFSPKKGKTPVQKVTYAPQDSPANCLSNLSLAYNDRDIDQYIKLFASDYTFVFAAEDVNNPTNPTPASWGLADERRSQENMFHDELVNKITLSFDQDVAVDSSPEHEATWKINVTNVNLRLDTRLADGTLMLLKVNSGKATFFFKQYANETASNGRPLWRIWQWEDKPMNGAALAAKPQLSGRHAT